MYCWACSEEYEGDKCPYCGTSKEAPKLPEPELIKEEPKKKTLKEKLTGK